MPAGYEELAGGYEHIKNSKIFSMANTKIVYLFIYFSGKFSVLCCSEQPKLFPGYVL